MKSQSSTFCWRKGPRLPIDGSDHRLGHRMQQGLDVVSTLPVMPADEGELAHVSISHTASADELMRSTDAARTDARAGVERYDAETSDSPVSLDRPDHGPASPSPPHPPSTADRSAPSSAACPSRRTGPESRAIPAALRAGEPQSGHALPRKRPAPRVHLGLPQADSRPFDQSPTPTMQQADSGSMHLVTLASHSLTPPVRHRSTSHTRPI